ncbi:MAG TPA: NADH-quinone oxidoreductase subunit F, partial [Dehalococcoidia bacterium]|nr:NADH-quinone oxidoreductase subunit F [Dehalococcoidia bacterium]
MTFEEINRRSKSEWEALQRGSYILVGTATCGRAAGALDVVDAFNKGLTRQGLEVPIIQVGCMGL